VVVARAEENDDDSTNRRSMCPAVGSESGTALVRNSGRTRWC
jgi:hypothetical protein